jgi:hypothetical protein
MEEAIKRKDEADEEYATAIKEVIRQMDEEHAAMIKEAIKLRDEEHAVAIKEGGDQAHG